MHGQTVLEIKAKGSPLPPPVSTEVSQLVRMARQILVITILLICLYRSDSRPQSFFSEFNQAFSNQGFSNGAIKSPNPTRQSFSRPNQPSARRGPSLSVFVPGSGDIIEQTRTQMDSLKNTITFLARKPEAAPMIEKVFAGRSNNMCFTNIEEAITAIETITKQVENAGTEIKLLLESVQEFSKIQNMSFPGKGVSFHF